MRTGLPTVLLLALLILLIARLPAESNDNIPEGVSPRGVSERIMRLEERIVHLERRLAAVEREARTAQLPDDDWKSRSLGSSVINGLKVHVIPLNHTAPKTGR